MYQILYVDDDPGLLEIGKFFLEDGGQFSVDTITSAPAALDLLLTKAYDAIISDYQMPDMDGIGFLKTVRLRGDTIPFILFTGRGREEIVIQALNEGADYYLQKGGEPVAQFTELAHKIRQAVQHRRAKISICDHERREADILNFLPDATFAIDTNGVVISWNRATEEMTGVRKAEILGKGNYEYALPFYGTRRPLLIDLVKDYDERVAEKYPGIVRDGDTYSAEVFIPRFRQGRGAYFRITASPLYDSQGTLTGTIESVHDTTTRVMAEKTLRESEEKYRTVFENTGAATMVLEEDCLISLANNEFADLSGFSKDAIEGKKQWTEFVAREDRDRMLTQHRLRRQDPGKALPGYEFRFVTKSGDIRIISMTVDIIPGTKKSIASLRDITDRKQAEDAVRAAEEKFSTIYRQSPDIIWISELDSGRFIDVNDAAERTLGYTREELICRSAYDLGLWVNPEDRDILMERIQKEGRVDHFPTRHRRKNGEIFEVESTVSTIVLSGKKYMISTVRDISGMRRTEEALKLENLRMESLLSLHQMSIKTDAEITAKVVEDAVRLTGSTLGYLATLNDDESVMTMQYWSRSAHESCTIVKKPLVYALEKTGLWGEAVRQRKPVITNDYAAENTYKRGTPEGHVPLTRHMNIPVFEGDHIVALAGVGNKDADYDEGDVRQLQLLMQGWWQIMVRKRAEEEIRLSNAILKTQLESSLDGIIIVNENEQILNFNRNFLAIWGLPYDLITSRIDEPVLQHVAGQVTHPEQFLARVRHLLDHKDEKGFENLLLNDGRILEWFSAPMLGETNEYFGRICVFRDITGRMETQNT